MFSDNQHHKKFHPRRMSVAIHLYNLVHSRQKQRKYFLIPKDYGRRLKVKYDLSKISNYVLTMSFRLIESNFQLYLDKIIV